ncbi:MAG: gamma-glutamyltransferase family protein [Herpetosiphon sp.]
MLDFDPLYNPYAGQRMPVVARRGVVATGQPLAAQAGLTMLQRGGNAVDAAVATAIALTVLEPTSNGIGGDAFALVWDGKLHGLNASGRAPGAMTADHVRGLGHTTMPHVGWLPVTVPGAPRAWRDLHDRWGKLPFQMLFEPAIRYADEGYPLSPVLARSWSMAAERFGQLSDPCFSSWMTTFMPEGFVPATGEVWRSPGHAATLRELAETGSEAMYSGSLARRIVDWAAATGGMMTAADLAAHRSSWVDPISANYHGYHVWEIPPNGQGLAALMALNILDGLDLPRHARDSVESFHLQIEAMKLAFADAHRYIADPEHSDVPLQGLLDLGYAEQRRVLIGQHARVPEAGAPPRGGTVYLCATDGDGMMVSLIQSNYMGFGSGIVVPDTGIALHNRGADFSLAAGHANELKGGKRPFHTIIPSFLTKDGQPIGPFGVMGGDMQPQGHLQMVVNTVDYHMNPQASLDAPRWRWTNGLHVDIEAGATPALAAGLARRRHLVSIPPVSGGFGRGQIIWRLPNGSYIAGSEGRTDGCAVGW